MSLVNGYRVKCQSYKRMADREAEVRRREERLGEWSLEKASRRAAVRQLRNKLRGPGVQGSASSGSGWTELVAEDQMAQEASLRTQDEVAHRRIQEDKGSFQDTGMSKSEKSSCCSCSIM